ncbi:hypothetical protein ACIBQ1_37925 [Nonomuraea sp. NPDC050153]|uniref:hypothetical protein n=1 Tax=Nonomuraea sp. NPDC050153 TaxID=3364359 RepID=UPI0037B8A942
MWPRGSAHRTASRRCGPPRTWLASTCSSARAPSRSKARWTRPRPGSPRCRASAPDAPAESLLDSYEAERRPFQLLAGPRWTLIGYGVPRAGLRVHTTGVRGDILDGGGHLRDAYALSPDDWVLIRPDGYVALVTADLATVGSYLDRAGLRRSQS